MHSLNANTLRNNPLVVINLPSDDWRNQVTHYLPLSFELGEITYSVKGLYSIKDISRIVGLTSGQRIEHKDIMNAVFYLQQLDIFKSIKLEFTPMAVGVWNLHCLLEQFSIIDRVKVSGFLSSKQKIKNLYVLQPGDVFDQQKHDYSLQQIRQMFQDVGYFQAEIFDLVLQKEDLTRCSVYLGIDAGRRFKINTINMNFECVGNLDIVDLEHIKKYVQQFLVYRLDKRYYSLDLVSGTQQKLKTILEQMGFSDAQITIKPTKSSLTGLVDIDVEVVLEKKREFVIWGNAFFKKEQILDHLMLYGKSIWHFPGSIIADEIEQLYKNSGFWNATVTIKEERQRMFCYIQEGVRSSLGAVSLHNAEYSLGPIFFKQAFDRCLRLKYFDKDLLKKSLDVFLKSYKKQGFWDVQVINEEFIPLQKLNRYRYAVTIQEGKRRFCGAISVIDYPEIQAEMQKRWLSQTQSGFDLAMLSDQRQWLLNYFKGKGHLQVQVMHELEMRDEFVDVVWRVQVSDVVARFGKTLFLGNSHAPINALMGECLYEEGDVWDKQKLEATLRNFKDISVFDSVQIYSGKNVDEFGYKPVFIKLIEAEKYELKSRFGLQQVGKNLQFKRGFTYKVGASLLVNQVFSSVDRCLFHADVTRFYRDLAVAYEVPWFKGYPIRSEWKLYDTLYQQPVYVGSQYSLYKASQQGFLWNAARTIKDLVMSCSVGVEFMGLFEADQPKLSEIIKYDKNLISSRIGHVFIEPTVMWRRLDNALNPRSGFFALLSAKTMFDFNNKVSFCKLFAEYAHYIPVLPSVTAALRVRSGHVFNRSFMQLHPIERFYLGGSSSIRGYDRDYCPPFGVLSMPIKDEHAGLPPVAHDFWRYAPQGGRTMFNVNAELRCNVYKKLGIVLFTDWGALFQNSIHATKSSCQPTTFTGSGAGIRYDTPIGPLRFDIGFKWKINQPDLESRSVFYISLGQAF